ncbi:MAG: 4-(cytidine 5'-diphospho)-2-C-methyl-D-erythritol kinase [Candidatus Omnitrophica bacterium]|nr:4-(cytidine 5'-diphospho)-2-C-methyl-D-erythritol kinase [Candidatus Omnitrophota bacterium]MBL7210625.1 4-(cytidine 5'-diphospho)-2-C-methyl-D-erythritol kinase [Candidatus Omnitrophota bacterium]
MGKLVLDSYAKLNLYLAVLNKRRDNYHNIETLFERIDLCDKIILTTRRDRKIRVICSDPLVPKGNTNLCYRSAKLLSDNFNIKKGLQIRIIKRIPVGAGLGGGSSNAAALLLGLNRLWALRLSRKKMLEFAKRIGSDVPFFLYGCSFARGFGRGDKIRPLKPNQPLRLWHLLVVPRFKVSTPLIYGKWDEFSRLKTPCKSCGSGLTIPKFDVKILPSLICKDACGLAGRMLFNSLEEVAARAYPQIRRIRERLVSLGLKTILMSGSGPAVFGIVSSRKEGLTLRRKIRRIEKSWRIYVTGTF